MNKHHVLLMCGGGSSEHDISLLSANFLEQQLKGPAGIEVVRVRLFADHWQAADGRHCSLGLDKQLLVGGESWRVDYVVPCIHGFPVKLAIFNPARAGGSALSGLWLRREQTLLQ